MSLNPEDALEKARHRTWIEFGSGILDSIGSLYNAKEAESFEMKRLELREKFQQVELEIRSTPFFQGVNFIW